MDGGCGTFAPRLSGMSFRPDPLCNETCDFEAVEWTLRKFIFLSSGRIGERSKLVFLPVFRIAPSPFPGNEKLALNSDALPPNRVLSGNELDAVMSSCEGGNGKRKGLPGAEGDKRDAGEPPSRGPANRGGAGADRGDTKTSPSASSKALLGGIVTVIRGRLECALTGEPRSRELARCLPTRAV